MYFTVLLLALPVTYGALPVTVVLLFLNPNFLRWYRQKPWLKAILMASAATLLREIIIVLVCLALAKTWGVYFLYLFLLDYMIASSIPGATEFVEWFLGPRTNQGGYPLFASLLVSVPFNFALWLTVFSTITLRTRPAQTKTRPMGPKPRPDRWAGRG